MIAFASGITAVKRAVTSMSPQPKICAKINNGTTKTIDQCNGENFWAANAINTAINAGRMLSNILRSVCEIANDALGKLKVCTIPREFRMSMMP